MNKCLNSARLIAQNELQRTELRALFKHSVMWRER